MALERCANCGNFKNYLGVCPDCGTGYYEITLVAKVRRRVEDHLRKANEETIIKVAEMLNIKTT